MVAVSVNSTELKEKWQTLELKNCKDFQLRVRANLFFFYFWEGGDGVVNI